MGYYRRRQRQPWRDVMQVCMNGHVINDGYHKFPKYNKEFCDRCGEKTIINCPNCNIAEMALMYSALEGFFIMNEVTFSSDSYQYTKELLIERISIF